MAIYHGAGGAGDSTNDAVVTEVANYASQAATSATNAGNSATNASSSATSAASSASSASSSATSAASSVSSAQAAAVLAQSYSNDSESSAEDAAASAALADTYRQQAEDSKNAAAASYDQAATLVTDLSADLASIEANKLAAEEAEANAQTYATNSANSSTSAASSAASASTSASTATTKAGEASTSATNAAASAATAVSASNTASTKASEASTSATNAASSASAASTSASSASTSASAASSSASSASSSASAASTSATNAASSASAASTSASNAASSATSSLNSANSAATAQSAAEAARDVTLAAFDSFDDRYLGAKSSDPTLDNDGNALAAGAIYFNTTASIMKVYTGSLWVAAYVSGTDFLAKASNLSDLPSAATARTNLGLGSAATTSSTDYATAAQGTKADTAYGWGNHASAGYLTSIADGSVTPAKLSTGHPTWDASGNLGVGTTSPSEKLEVYGSIYSTNTSGWLASSGRYNGTSNGAILWQNGSSSNFGIAEIAVNKWSLGYFTNLPSAVAISSVITYDSSGNVGIGTSSPNGKFAVSGSGSGAYITETLENTNSGGYVQKLFRIGSSGGSGEAQIGYAPGILFAIGPTANDTTTPIVFRNNNATERARISAAGGFSVGTTADPGAGAIYATGNITAYYSSDRTLKENIKDVDGALDKVCAIGSKTFDWTDEYIAAHGGEDGYFVQKSDFGVVAQDVQAVFPQAVRTREDGTLAVDYEKLSTLAFGAIKELLKRVEALEAK